MKKNKEVPIESAYDAILPEVEDIREPWHLDVFMCLVYWAVAIFTVWFVRDYLNTGFDSYEHLLGTLRPYYAVVLGAAGVCTVHVVAVVFRKHVSSATVWSAVFEGLFVCFAGAVLGKSFGAVWLQNAGTIYDLYMSPRFMLFLIGTWAVGGGLLLVKTAQVIFRPKEGYRTN